MALMIFHQKTHNRTFADPAIHLVRLLALCVHVCARARMSVCTASCRKDVQNLSCAGAQLTHPQTPIALTTPVAKATEHWRAPTSVELCKLYERKCFVCTKQMFKPAFNRQTFLVKHYSYRVNNHLADTLPI